ncbi:MAG TPA: O-antigen ligase family protein [candidate division Zixibacteria bacterium]|nr:O-antigen ligase family protein [candidate division Zixibacteria bacterium]
MTRSSLTYLGHARAVCLTGFCLNFTYAIAYSHICLGAALAFLAAEWYLLRPSRLSAADRFVYRLCGVFVALCALSAVVNDTPLQSLSVLREEWLFLLVPLVVFTVKNPRHRNWVVGGALLSTAALALYGWLQRWLGFNLRPELPLDFGPDGFYRASGAFHNTLTYGNLFALLSILFLVRAVFESRPRWRYACALTGALALGATVFSYGRGPILGVSIGLLVFFVFALRRNWKVSLGSLAVLVALIAIFSPGIFGRFAQGFRLETEQYETAREKSSSRMTIWRTSARVVADNPLFGVGAGNFESAYREHADSDVVRFFTHAHNDLLNISAYAGIPATLAYLGLWVAVLWRLYRAARAGRGWAAAALAASVTFLVCSLTEATFADEEVRAGLMLVWGLGLAEASATEPTDSQSIMRDRTVAANENTPRAV